MWKKLYSKLQRVWYRLVTLKSSPRKIALGLALGVAIAFMPPVGLQTVLAITLAALFRVNPVSAVAGTYVTNVFTAWPLYLLCYNVGSAILGVSVSVPDGIHEGGLLLGLLRIGKAGLTWIAVEFVGGMVVGPVTAVPAYFIALFAVVKYRRARLARRIAKMHERMEQAGPQAQG